MSVKYFLKNLFNKKRGILVMTLIMMTIIVSGCFSFAIFTSNAEKKGALNIITGNLHSLITSPEFNSAKQVTVPAGETLSFDITLTNVNDIDAKFNLYYSSIQDLTDVKVGYTADDDDAPGVDGYIVNANSSKTNSKIINTTITNGSTEDITITFGSDVGLTNKTLTFPDTGNVIPLIENPVLGKEYIKGYDEQWEPYVVSDVNLITISSKINISKATDVIKQWDASVAQDGSIIAYTTPLSSGGEELHIEANGKISLPVDSSYLFKKNDGSASFEAITGLENLETSKVEDMSYMFQGDWYNNSKIESLNLSSFDTSNVKTMKGMFKACGSLIELDLTQFNTDKVEDMSYMFSECTSLINIKLENFNTSNVTDMSYMFAGHYYDYNDNDKLDLRNFNTSNVTTMEGMFMYNPNMTEIKVSTSWVTASNNIDMFTNCGVSSVTVV